MTQEKNPHQMTFFQHLDEVRVRLVRAAAVFFLGFLLSWGLFTEWVIEFLRAPLFDILPEEHRKLYFTGLFENFLTHLKIAGYTAIFIFAPYFFWEVWAFVAPGLYPRERKYAFPFICAATFFFIAGAAFAYYLLFPVAFKFFIEFGVETDSALLTIGSYYSTALKLLLLFGISFELPVIISLLGMLGVLKADMLRKNRPSIIIGITVVCAMFAPPDPISMLVMMCPLILFFEASIYVVQFFGNRRAREEAQRAKSEDTEKQDIQPQSPTSSVPAKEE